MRTGIQKSFKARHAHSIRLQEGVWCSQAGMGTVKAVADLSASRSRSIRRRSGKACHELTQNM